MYIGCGSNFSKLLIFILFLSPIFTNKQAEKLDDRKLLLNNIYCESGINGDKVKFKSDALLRTSLLNFRYNC